MTTAEILVRLFGAIIGSALALVFWPPRSRSGFLRRGGAGMVAGMVFTGYVHDRIGFSDDLEGVLQAACATAFVAWFVMGATVRIAKGWMGK